MDVEADEQSIISSGSRQSSETVYASLDQVKVSFYSNLPMEVSHVLKHAGMLFSQPQDV
jgi:glycerate-2-kinase